MAIYIKDINYISMDGPVKIQRGSIRIEGRRILEMGNVDQKWGDRIIYGHDKLALPGFVNGHTHAGMSLLRGYGGNLPLFEWLELMKAAEAKLTPDDIYWGTLMSQLEMLRSGITTYADMYYDCDASQMAMEESGMRAVLSEGLVDDDGRGEVYLRNALRLIDNARDKYQGRITYALAPHAPYSCSRKYLQQIAFEAQMRDLPVHIHIAETQQEQEQCMAHTGKRVIPYLRELGLLDGKVFAAHMIHLDQEELDIVRDYGVSAIHCPLSNMKLASGVFPWKEYAKRGITVGLGTDGPASNDNLDILEELRTASLLQKVSTGDASVLTPGESLAMLTREGAKALGLEKSIGILKPGMLADITILSLWRPYFYPRLDDASLLNHILYGAKGSDVHTVICNGNVLLSGGRAEHLDEGQIYKEIRRRAKRLFQK